MGRLGRSVCALLGAMSIGACDWIAQDRLRPGESTLEDVHRLMGTPDAVWEQADGASVLEFSRGPMGYETWMVEIGPDGRFRAMRNALVSENFARVVPGMKSEDLRRLLGRPAETTRFALRPDEEVWTWRFQEIGRDPELFHVRIAIDGTVVASETGPDSEGPRRAP